MSNFHSCFSALCSTRESNTRLWNQLLKRSLDAGNSDQAVGVYAAMRRLGVEHDGFTLPLVNQAVLRLTTGLLCGEMVHCVGLKMGFGLDVYFCNTLIEVYINSAFTGLAARRLFEEMHHRDLVTWTSVISGYAGEADAATAFELFNRMRIELDPNSVTVISMLQACSNYCPVSAWLGKQLHGFLSKNGLIGDGSVANSLLNAYANDGPVSEDIDILFDEMVRPNTVAWSILISFRNSRGDVAGAINAFRSMQQQDISPSVETLTTVVSVLSKLGHLAQAQQLHCFAVKSGFCDRILLTCLLGLYAKWDDFSKSARLFGEIPYRNQTTWSSMISGLIEQGHVEKVADLIKEMQATGFKHDAESVTTLLEAYTDLGALHKGKEIHGYVLRNLMSDSIGIASVLETSILNMYARCGSISCARNSFNLMVNRDIVAWTSMIEGLGTYGLGREALDLFDQMQNEGISPNSITFLTLLSACAHSGLTSEGCQLFHAMKWQFLLEPELHHYTCMVDLLGRKGKLREALSMVLKMLCSPDGRIWGALLAASRVYMDKKIGDYAAKRVLELEPDNVGYQIVLSNIQACAGQWDGAEMVRNSVKEKDLKKKTPGWSCIEIKGKLEGFVAGDRSHPLVDEIFGLLTLLSLQMQDIDMHSLDRCVK